MPQACTNRQYTAPAAAVGVSVTPSGTAWLNSSWVELLAATDADCALTGVIVVTPGVAATFEVDIGVGAAAAEVRIATLKGRYQDASFCGHGYMALPIPVAAIPNGSRIAVRMRKTGTNTTAWVFAITYLKLPITGGDLLTTARPTVVSAPAANLTTLTANTNAWLDGTWTQVLAAAAADMVIVGLALPSPFNGADYVVEIGKGGAGSELVIGAFKGYVSGHADGPSYVPLWNPIGGITAGTRIAARWRKAGTSATGLPFGIVYQELPL